ncbi:MAG TPA: non-homologous end-joining DNA ligase [Chthonomonadaceae bacterium]|nr:non-homologous end-joining DNA ligase [Chthonomonadaceae bacterium]
MASSFLDREHVGPDLVSRTHPERVLFPQDGISKGDLMDYYLAVSVAMLPHMRDRPLHMQRFPRGIGEEGFVQKEAPDFYPDWITRVTVEKEGGRLTQVICDNAATLLYLANQACITPHVWLSRKDRLHAPDRMIFDLDPAEDDFEIVRATARTLRSLLDQIGLPAFVMTTGSRGLHVSVPLQRNADFDMMRAFAQEIAAELARRDPERLTTEQRKEARRGRLFLDVGRNAYAQTAVAPYAVRARPGAPVATPLDWSELEDPQLHARCFTLRSFPRRLDERGDPWREIAQQATSLAAPQRRLEALQSGEGASALHVRKVRDGEPGRSE